MKIHQVAIKHNELFMNGSSGRSWEGHGSGVVAQSAQTLMIVTVGHGVQCAILSAFYTCKTFRYKRN